MDGLITIQSNYSVQETIKRISRVAESKGLIIFSRIDHAANATKAGLQLRPTELIIFGNPKAGTILMQDKQTSGIDLPLKALVWQDELGKVWLTYNDVKWIGERHGISENNNTVIKAIEEGMRLICETAVKT